MAERVKQSGTAPRVVLMGLAQGLAEELGKVLSQEGCSVRFEPLSPRHQALRLIDQANVDLVFCPTDLEQYAPFLEAMKVERPGLPVVVVSPLPEVAAWLDALEFGAVDYCAPPFEPVQIQWILHSVLRAA